MKYILLSISLLFAGICNGNDSTNVKHKEGYATYYSDKFHGRKTSSGEVFSQNKMTGASNFYRLGDTVKVTNPRNGKYVIVKINDRTADSTARRGTIIDLSKAAARELGIIDTGRAKVKIKKCN